MRKILALVMALAFVLAACGSKADGGGTVRIGWAGSPDSLNPGVAILTESYTIFELVYDSMYELNLDGSFSLAAAESVERSADGLVYTYKIHKDIKFHDGQPLTAKDIKFSYDFYGAHEDFPYMNPYTQYFETVEAPDDSTVVVTLTEAIPNIESQLVYLYILPEHIWKDYAEGSAATEFDNLEMIGSGPFEMVEYKQNEFVHLKANNKHFLAPPKVDEVIFQTFESQDVLVQAIKSGQVDMIAEMPATAVETLKGDPNVQVVSGAPFAPTVTDVIFNQVSPENCPTDAGGICTGHPALRDRNVRLALDHATDKQKLIDVVLLGYGTPGVTLIPDGLGMWFNSSIQGNQYDVARANQILDDAGYKDANGDGVRDMPDGSRPLTFRLNWPSDSVDDPRVAKMLSEMWTQVGVKVEMQAVDPDALTAQCCPAFDFDIIIWGWGSDPDPNLLLGVMTTDEIPTGSSETGYSNPEYDALYKQQSTELNLQKRIELVWKMQQIAFDDAVYVIPYYPDSIQAYRTDRFTGWLTGFPKLELTDVSSLVVIEAVKK
ncbi:MAG: ABC transporter substrate-binding protein [Anaerolineales bacterium]|mgnify:FL=1|nr:ABC transporter substrate-binding protein [Anaerolineales bacterium]MCZ2290144.1 ABC transporter substrate-binding protein [Anaerolineales bacterium]